MPLDYSGGKNARSHNISAEMHAGKPQKQAIAIAFSVGKRKKNKPAKKMAKGFGSYMP